MTALNVKKKCFLHTGGRSRQVQFVWNPMVDRNFHKLENGLTNRVVLPEGVVPERFYCMLQIVDVKEQQVRPLVDISTTSYDRAVL